MRITRRGIYRGKTSDRVSWSEDFRAMTVWTREHRGNMIEMIEILQYPCILHSLRESNHGKSCDELFNCYVNHVATLRS